MSEDIDIYTATMAKIYSEQGHFGKAAEIYRHLLKQEPDRQDFIQALSSIERKSSSEENSEHRKLVSLFVKWFELALGYNRFRTLETLQKRKKD